MGAGAIQAECTRDPSDRGRVRAITGAIQVDAGRGPGRARDATPIRAHGMAPAGTWRGTSKRGLGGRGVVQAGCVSRSGLGTAQASTGHGPDRAHGAALASAGCDTGGRGRGPGGRGQRGRGAVQAGLVARSGLGVTQAERGHSSRRQKAWAKWAQPRSRQDAGRDSGGCGARAG